MLKRLLHLVYLRPRQGLIEVARHLLKHYQGKLALVLHFMVKFPGLIWALPSVIGWRLVRSICFSLLFSAAVRGGGFYAPLVCILGKTGFSARGTTAGLVEYGAEAGAVVRTWAGTGAVVGSAVVVPSAALPGVQAGVLLWALLLWTPALASAGALPLVWLRARASD